MATLTHVISEPDVAIVGKPVPLVDSLAKVKGAARYTTDLSLPGMLWGAILRSPVSHARVTNIDIGRAKALPGVKAVITHRDVPHVRFGRIIPDEPVLTDRARFVGDSVAAVAAVDPDTAAEALELISVEYDPLPHVLDPEMAMEDSAPRLHDAKRNMAWSFHVSRGDVEAGFESSDFIYEATYETQCQYHAPLEPLCTIADWRHLGLTIWTPVQVPGLLAVGIAEALYMPMARIRLIQPYIGGGFGGKNEHKAYLIAAILSKVTGKPVKMAFSREEDVVGGIPSVPMRLFLKMGITKDGLFTAKTLRIIADNGAYTNIAVPVLSTACYRHDSLYKYSNVRVDGYLVYTNKPPTGAFRGFGNSQGHFAVECHIDALAEGIRMDPIEVRIRNAVFPGYTSIHGWRITSCGYKECLEEAARAAEWLQNRNKKKPYEGIGVAGGIHVSGNRTTFNEFDGASAVVRIDANGRVTVLNGEIDIGQGLRTVLAQIVAETLEIPLHQVTVEQVDTNHSPFGLGTIGSRCTFLAGNAVKIAAENAKKQLIKHIAELWQIPESELTYSRGIFRGGNGMQCSFEEACLKTSYDMAGSPIIGVGHYKPDAELPDSHSYGNISGAYSFAAHIVKVRVDPDTGRVTVDRVIAAHDCGNVINPLTASGQVDGGVLQGIGYTLSEGLVWNDDGVPQNPNLLDYKVLTSADAPDIMTVFTGITDPAGPYGAKSIGEIATVPTAPAVVNALYDALGVRFTRIPVTPEDILSALRNGTLGAWGHKKS